MFVGLLLCLGIGHAWAGSFLDNLQLTAADEVDIVTDLEDTVHVRSKRDTEAGTLEEICKYKKGSWSECDSLTKLLTRRDTLKPGMSESCEATRQVTKKCGKGNKGERRNAKNKERVACKYQKGKDVEFGPCQDTGVKTKKLSLISAAVSEHCPEIKVISKRCKNGKKKETRAKKKEKIEKQKARQEKKEKKKEERKAQKEQRKAQKEKRKAKKEKIEKNKVNQQPKKNVDDKCEFGDWEDWGPCTEGKQMRNRMIKTGDKRKKCLKKSTEKRPCSAV